MCAGRVFSPPKAGERPTGRRNGAGPGWSPIKLSIFLDETQRGNAPELVAFGVSMVGPVIYTFGSKAQKQRFLPRIIDLSDWWCQGFSEPGAGSDLASLRTSAPMRRRRLGDLGPEDLDHHGAIRRLDLRPRAHQCAGEKAGGHFVLPGRHEVAWDTVKPIQTIDGGHEVNEVFLDDVRVPPTRLSAKRTKAGTTPSFCSPTSATVSPASECRKRASIGSASWPRFRSMAPGRRSRTRSFAPNSPRSKWS